MPWILLTDMQPFPLADGELSSHDDTNTAEIIDQMFGEVLEYAGMMEQEKVGKGEDHDSGISTVVVLTAAESVKNEEKEEEKEADEEEDSGDEEEDSGDELLTFPSSGILSPLSKSVEAVVTPLVRPHCLMSLVSSFFIYPVWS